MRAILKVLRGAQSARRVVIGAGQKLTFGRTPAADLEFADDTMMSGQHFSVSVSGPACVICDLDSRNGTFVDEKRIVECVLSEGNVIRAGQTTFAVSFEDLVASPAIPVNKHLSEVSPTVQPAGISQPALGIAGARETTSNSAAAQPLSPGAQLALSLAQASSGPRSSPQPSLTQPPQRHPPNKSPLPSIGESYQAGLADPDPFVRRNAILAAVWHGQPWVLDYCRSAALTAAAEDREILLLLAVLGKAEDLSQIVAISERLELGTLRFAILGAYGHPQVMPAIMNAIQSQDANDSLAARRAFCKMTGVEAPVVEESSIRDTQVDPSAPARINVDAATKHWLELKRRFPESTRWCRGLDLSHEPSAEILERLDLESRWECCLRGRVRKSWKTTTLDLEQLADKLANVLG